MSTPHTPAPPSAEPLQAWREQALNAILLVGLGIGTIAIIVASINALRGGQPLFIPFYMLLFGSLAAATFVRRLPYAARTALMLAVPFVAGILDLYRFGLIANAAVLLLASVMLAALFLGQRGGLSLLAAALLMLAAAAWASAASLLDVVNPVLVFLVLGLVLVVAITSLVQRLNHSLHAAEQAAAAATAAQQQAEALTSQVRHQLAELETQYHTEAHLRDLVATLETPTIGLANGVLLAPIVGTIDSQRAQSITERLLTDASSQRAETVVIDIAGVAAVDTQVAQALIQMARALRLLGCTVVLSGISASIAQTLTQLGVALDELQIVRSPREIIGREQAE
jgi:anti-anti-sigma regulatory factor